MRAAIYARFSSEVQNARSIDDQIALCRRHAEARGWTVLTAYSDAAISGAAMANRPGLLAALAGAERGDFDILLTEAEDRIARNLEHLAHVVNRLEFAGARLATPSTDRVETMHVAMMGGMAQMFLANLSAKTKRGMQSNAEKGLATGSRIYGYRSAPGGALAIVDHEAEVVREIFARFAAGESPRAICEDLNLRQVPAVRGGLWNPSTLNGSRQRGNGLLNTELYAGVKVWNRVEMKKDPRTGARISRPRPAQEWKRTPVPHLAIVTEEAWAAAQARKRVALGQTPYQQRRRKPGVFSGLIKCAECGATMTTYDSRGRLMCAARREKGRAACGNARTVARAEVEARVLEGLRSRLLSPAAVRAYVRLYHQAWNAEQAAATSRIAPLRKRLAELERTIERLVDAICDGTATPAMRQRLQDQEAEKATLAEQLAEAERQAPPPIALHPGAAERYAKRVAELQAALASGAALDAPHWREAVDAVRDLVERIDVRVMGDEADAPVMVRLHGTLAAFLRPQTANDPQPGLYKAVAGARFSRIQTPPALPIAC